MFWSGYWIDLCWRTKVLLRVCCWWGFCRIDPFASWNLCMCWFLLIQIHFLDSVWDLLLVLFDKGGDFESVKSTIFSVFVCFNVSSKPSRIASVSNDFMEMFLSILSENISFVLSMLIPMPFLILSFLEPSVNRTVVLCKFVL